MTLEIWNCSQEGGREAAGRVWVAMGRRWGSVRCLKLTVLFPALLSS